MKDFDPKELRLKSGPIILSFIRRFSATEKVIFGMFFVAALVSTIALFIMATNIFMIDVPARGGEIREGVVGLPRTINPIIAITDVDKDLSTLIYSGLLKYRAGKLVTDIADSYTISSDGLIYDIKLKPEIYFQDNKPLTADDVAFTIEKIQDQNLKSPKRSDWANVTVNKISDTEIQFVLKKPYSPFLSNLTVGIIPKHIWGSVGDDQFIFSDYNINPIGSGPYKVNAILRDSGGIPTQYSLTTWDKYYFTKPYISSLVFNFFADEDKVIANLDAGKIDSAAAISPDTAAKLADDTAQAYHIISSPLPRIFGLFINQNQAPVLSDPNVRKALTMTVDRNAIVDKVMNGFGNPIYGPIPLGLINTTNPENSNTDTTAPADTNASTTPELENIKNAQALLAKSNWNINDQGILEKKDKKTASSTLSFSIYTADSPDLKATAELIKNSWTHLGAQVTIKVFEAGDLYQNVIRTRKYDVLLFGEQVGKDGDLYAFWHSSQRNAPGLNVSMYTNSKVDKILEDLRSTNDQDARTDDYRQLDAMIRDDMPAIFLYSPDFIYALPKKLQGITLDTITVPQDRWNSIGDWYVNTEKIWNFLSH